MKILLIGKYPPTQGGVSTKTYWLYKNLKQSGFEFRTITFQEDVYSIQCFHHDTNSIVLNERTPPWHLPSTSLLTDRLINSSFKAVESFEPDIVESNYLWPFSAAALLISKMIKKPLLIRHAGSDVQKFYADNEFREIMKFYFRNASVVVTNATSAQLIKNMMSNNLNNLLCKSRYIPDPKAFRFGESAKTFDILFAGKINYHWKYKGLLILLELIKKRKLKALFVIGGKYVSEILNLISSNGLEELIVVSSFVSPEEMPRVYGASKYVWCWEEEGTIDDFSNIIWEAIFCNVPCIINKEVLRKREMSQIIDIFPHLIYGINQDDIADFEFDSKAMHFSEVSSLKSSLFNDYIKSNLDIYQEVLTRTS